MQVARCVRRDSRHGENASVHIDDGQGLSSIRLAVDVFADEQPSLVPLSIAQVARTLAGRLARVEATAPGCGGLAKWRASYARGK
jgi:hypothetical protein